MLIEQIIEFQLKVLGPMAVRVVYHWLFPLQIKNL